MKGMWILAATLTLLLSGCSGIYNSGPETGDRQYYYEGFEGVVMDWQPNSPPHTLYYYSDGDKSDNAFDISVKLMNKGASLTQGGLFVSGYDPGMIKVEGVEIDEFSFADCSFDLESIGGGMQGRFDCFFLSGSKKGSDWDLGFDFGDMCEDFGWDCDLWDDLDIRFGKDGGDWVFDLDYDREGISIDYFNHGKLLIGTFGVFLNFGQNNGREYYLEGDTYTYPGGGTDFIDWEAYVKSWPLGLDETDQTFLVTNCYLYTTYASPQICIDPAPYSETEKVCRPGIQSWKSNGAPVTINVLEQENTPRKIFFTMEISNTGTGDIFHPASLGRCSPYFPGRVTSKDLDVVWIGDIRLSGDPERLKCTPDYEVRLQDGRGTFTCEYDVKYATAKSAYEAPIVIELWYGYRETDYRSVRFKRVS